MKTKRLQSQWVNCRLRLSWEPLVCVPLVLSAGQKPMPQSGQVLTQKTKMQGSKPFPVALLRVSFTLSASS